jgi:glycine cleavage system H protein
MAEEVRDGLKYTESHEWLNVKEDTVIIGITDHAQAELTDIVFVELPEIGKEIEVNKKLDDSPEIINESPYNDGWLVELEIENKSELDSLLDAASYKKILK